MRSCGYVGNVDATSAPQRSSTRLERLCSVCDAWRWASTALHRAAPRCTALHRAAPRCTALHRAAPRCTALHRAAPRCTALHRSAPLCTALHRAAPRCTALHRAAPRCTASMLRKAMLRSRSLDRCRENLGATFITMTQLQWISRIIVDGAVHQRQHFEMDSLCYW